jgi:putative ABC transport system ATP-binding protein
VIDVRLDPPWLTALALTGESGSGKSTLLHICAGLEPADGGAVLVAGQDIATLPEAARAACGAARWGWSSSSST